MRNQLTVVPDYGIQFVPIPVSRVAYEWDELVRLLRPVTHKVQGKFDQWDLLDGLMTGRSEGAYLVSDKMKGAFVTEVGYHEGVKCCWINYAGGSINASPKEGLRMVRYTMAKFEALAKAQGCAEMRLGGRSWAAILPDYKPYAELPNGLRKVLK